MQVRHRIRLTVAAAARSLAALVHHALRADRAGNDSSVPIGRALHIAPATVRPNLHEALLDDHARVALQAGSSATASTAGPA
jgi:hypothetical protein